MNDLNSHKEERLPCSIAMRLRLLFCVLIFIIFTFMEGRMSPYLRNQIYEKLEEPMSVKTIQTWVRNIRIRSYHIFPRVL